jgi:hypothetical protein
MIYLLFVYFLVTTICFCAGLIFYALFPSPDIDNSSDQKPFFSYLVTGLIVITLLGQWIVLFFPLNSICFLLVILILTIIFLIFRKTILSRSKRALSALLQKNTGSLLCFGSLLFMILILNAGPTIMDDTDSYQIQMIKWVREYGSVPGLANLHLRFGFNSSWFISIGLLSPQVKGINVYLVINGLLSAWFCHYLLEKISTIFSKQPTAAIAKLAASSFFLLLICVAAWPMIRGNAATSNYDFITTCCVVVLCIETALLSRRGFQQEWLIWPCYLFTVRIINYPLLLLTIVALVQLYKYKKLNHIAAYGLLILLVTIPFVIRNIILSGYPFFPIYQADFFSFDWKADKQKTVEIVDYIKYFNRVNIQQQALSVTRQLRFPNWVTAWFHFLFTYDKILVAISLCSYLAMLWFRKKLTLHLSFYSRFFLYVMIFQLLSWFFIAPDPRFVYGPLLCGIFYLLFFICPFPGYRVFVKMIKLGLVATTIGILFYSIRKIETEKEYSNWIIPKKLPIPEIREIVIDGIELKIPGKVLNNWNPRCYDVELPCLYEVDPRLRARGKTIRQGFRLEK